MVICATSCQFQVRKWPSRLETVLYPNKKKSEKKQFSALEEKNFSINNEAISQCKYLMQSNGSE